MANVFINGLKSKTGGGKSIFSNYLTLLSNHQTRNKFFILTPDYNEYSKFSFNSVEIIDIPGVYKHNIFAPVLYSLIIPKLLQQYKIDLIFNLGDIIIPTSIPQLYLFDWAYAVYPDSIVWKRMDIKTLIKLRVKKFAIEKYIKKATTIIVQTKTIKARLISLYGLNNVEIVPNAVNIENMINRQQYDFDLPSEKRKLLYLTNYHSHKNLEILIPLARKILISDLPFCIIVTIEKCERKLARKFLEEVESLGLQQIIKNIGTVASPQIPSLYNQCDALIMPTLLESYGLPYVEAMYHQKTVFTSNLDFAQDVCGDAAYYFDPLDANSILDSIKEAFEDEETRFQKIQKGNFKISQLLTWSQVFNRYQDLLESLLVRI